MKKAIFFILAYFVISEGLPDLIFAQTAQEIPQTENDGKVFSINNAPEAVDKEGDKEEDKKTSEENGIADPLEPWNRFVFGFNDRFYFWLVKPLAQGYSAVVPEWGRIRVRNIFHNITTPVRFVNNLLQLKVKGAGTELVRFIVNTTAGVGGMFDIAGKNLNLKANEEDLGQTLGVYGFGEGFYIVLPVLGSSSLRDTFGTAGDIFLNPVSHIPDTETVYGVYSYDYINENSLLIGEYEDLKEAALDPYISFRNAYFEHRKSKVKE